MKSFNKFILNFPSIFLIFLGLLTFLMFFIFTKNDEMGILTIILPVILIPTSLLGLFMPFTTKYRKTNKVISMIFILLCIGFISYNSFNKKIDDNTKISEVTSVDFNGIDKFPLFINDSTMVSLKTNVITLENNGITRVYSSNSQKDRIDNLSYQNGLSINSYKSIDAFGNSMVLGIYIVVKDSIGNSIQLRLNQ